MTGPVLVGALAFAAALAVLGVSSALDRTEVAADRRVAEIAGIAVVAGALAAVVDARARPAGSAREDGRLDLEDRLRRALADSDDVDDALSALEQAAAGVAPGRSVAVWRMDDGNDRLIPARLATPSGPEPRHLPGLPAECLALRTGSTAITRSSADFDACPHLRPTPEPVSGVCVPLVVDGRRLGVLRWTGEPEHALAADDLATLETLATLTAWRAAVLDDGSLDVPPVILDPLTGMMNRYSTGLAIRELVRGLVPFSLGVCQLDEAAGYGQHHGAAVGDRAIRLLATTLRSTLRPGDIVGRTDGDRFTVAFPHTSTIDAAHALERVREALVLRLADGEVPPFTVSCGVAASDRADSIGGIVDAAESAVDEATAAGRNRVVVAGDPVDEGA